MRSKVRASKYTADRESGDSVGEACSTSQAGLCNPLGVRGTAPPPSSTALPRRPPTAQRRGVLTPTHPSNTLHVSTTFLLCRGTRLCCLPLETLSHLLTPLPPWQSLSLPPYPGGRSFLNCKKLMVTAVRAEVSLMGIWQEAYTHSYPILAFLPDQLQPICQRINRQLLHPKTSPLHTPDWDILRCKTHLKSLTRQSPTRGGWRGSWSEHPLPTPVPRVPGEGNQAQDILSWWREMEGEPFKKSSASRSPYLPI